MTVAINLLPWRQQQRLKRIRLWVYVAIGCLLSLLLTECIRAASLNGQKEQQRLYGKSLLLLQNTLRHKQQRLLELEREQQTVLQSMARRQSVKDWEPRLIELAEGLPANVWLDTLAVANGKMAVSGHAATPGEIHSVEAHFQNLHGISAVQMGEVSRDPGRPISFAISMSLAQGVKNG